jgi:DNA-binding NtrC family response regulator
MSEEKSGKILIADANADVLQEAQAFLQRHFGQVDTEQNPKRLAELIPQRTYEVMLMSLDWMKDPARPSRLRMEKILEADPLAVVILIAQRSDLPLAVQWVKAGAIDFVVRPWDNEKLLATVLAGLRLRQVREEAETLKEKNREMTESIILKYDQVVGRSKAMQRVRQTIDLAANADVSVLIVGETGTGKELAARTVHAHSARQDEILLPVDLGALTDSRFDSELFGHRRGAFAEALKDRPGFLEKANGGTLFLEEIGKLPLPQQATLLSVLQSKTVRRVGTRRDIPLDLRIICTSQTPLYDLVKAGRFLPELLEQINTLQIEIPPLRNRMEDVPLLAAHFLRLFNQKFGKSVRRISNSAMAQLTRHPWPGNVRELQRTFERAVMQAQGDLLLPEDFAIDPPALRNADGHLTVTQFKLDDMEKVLIHEVMQKVNGNITRAAVELGLTRQSLYRRLEQHGL